MNPIAEFVKKRRKEAGLTQKEFAMRSGLGLRFVRDLEQEWIIDRQKNIYAAIGNRGNVIYVDPGKNTVITAEYNGT